MTFEQLLEMPVVDINELTDAQLTEYLRAYFPQTRPRDTFTLDVVAPAMPPEIAAKVAAAALKPSLIKQCKSSTSTPPASSIPTAKGATPSKS